MKFSNIGKIHDFCHVWAILQHEYDWIHTFWVQIPLAIYLSFNLAYFFSPNLNFAIIGVFTWKIAISISVMGEGGSKMAPKIWRLLWTAPYVTCNYQGKQNSEAILS